jgi:hypothetical protein
MIRLVSSHEGGVFAIRDHVLPLIRQHGTLQVQHGAMRLIVWQWGTWTFNHWTPFNDLAPGESSSPAYRHALERQHTRPDLAYGLDIWRGAKVFSLLWADDASFQVIRFIRGPWEDEVLAL